MKEDFLTLPFEISSMCLLFYLYYANYIMRNFQDIILFKLYNCYNLSLFYAFGYIYNFAITIYAEWIEY